MKKVLIVATSRKTRGGISSVVHAHTMGKCWDRYHCYWLETHRDHSLPFKFLYFGRAMMEYLVKVPQYDLVHVHFSNYPSALRKFFFVGIARLLRKKIILHFHGYNTADSVEALPRLYRHLFRQADRVLVLSSFWRNIVSDYCDANKIQVLYNPCPIVIPHPIPKEKWILYAGTVNKRKGYDVLIRAFARIAARYPDWKIVFAGNGDIREGQNLARELDISNQIHFAGWVSGEDKNKLFSQSSVFCLPSYAEGFPMAVLDAWAYHLPVLATSVGGLTDMAEDGRDVLILEPGNPEQISQRLEEILENTELMSRLSLRSKELAQGTFSTERSHAQLEHIWKEILTQSNHHGEI